MLGLLKEAFNQSQLTKSRKCMYVHSLEMKLKLLPASKNPIQKYIDR